MRPVMVALFLVGFGASAGAQDLPNDQRAESFGGLRALGTADAAQDWRAVGRLDTGSSFCSATLIAPDLVLTAAHCVFDQSTHRRFSPEELTFSAGLRNGRADSVRSIRRMVVMPDYIAEAGEQIEMIGLDLALLELQHPISAVSIPAIPVGRGGASGEPVTVVSYGEDREAHASIEEGCAVLASSGPVRSLSCEVVSGASGSPVLRIVDGRVEVVAVMSAHAVVNGEPVSLAVTLDGQMATLLDERDRQGVFGGTSMSGNGLAFIGAGNDGRARLGARFVRP